MSRLYDFLHPVAAQEEKDVVISKRFIQRDEQGNPILDEQGNAIPKPFKIKALTQAENDAITRQSRKTRKVNGQIQEYLDSTEFSQRMVVAATVDPDFSNTEMCQAYGVLDPLMVPGKMLLGGEYARLLSAITELSGFDDSFTEDTAKN